MTVLTEGSKSSTEISQWQPLSSKASSPVTAESAAYETGRREGLFIYLYNEQETYEHNSRI